MKKIFIFLVAVLLTATTFAQTPEKMSYQAIVRDSGDALVTNQAVGMQISILQTTATGTAVYVETQTPTSNVNGLVTLEIGTGSVVSGDFSTIDWSADSYFIKTETDPVGGSNYTITGINQLLSVPYALYAKTSGSSTPGPTGPQGNPGPQGPTAPAGLARNWMFGNAQGGGGGNVGLEFSLPKINAQGQIFRVLVSKFAAIEGESISSVKILLYSNINFNLGLTIVECTFDASNPDAVPNILYPRTGDGSINDGTNTVVTGQLIPITGQGLDSYGKCPQLVEFIIDPPISPSESVMELFISNISNLGSTASVGIYQLIIE
jgi:hypothetical protein